MKKVCLIPYFVYNRSISGAFYNVNEATKHEKKKMCMCLELKMKRK